MKKLIEKIQEKIDRYVVKRFQALAPSSIVQALYKRQAIDQLQLTEKIINVKKGKRRYTLIVCKDRNLQTIFNIGRH
jgi:hypothetical protein